MILWNEKRSYALWLITVKIPRGTICDDETTRETNNLEEICKTDMMYNIELHILSEKPSTDQTKRSVEGIINIVSYLGALDSKILSLAK